MKHLALCFHLALFPAATAFALATEFGLNASTYLGDISGSEAVYGMVYQSDGTLVVAANLGPAVLPGVTAVYLNGATDASPGTILRLSGGGETVLSVTRLATAVYDLSVDGSDRLLVAAGIGGLLQLNPAADNILAASLAGSFVYRTDSAADGHAVALVPDNPGDADQQAGNGTVYLFDTNLAQLNSFSGGFAHTLDVAIDGTSETIFTIGFSNKSTWGGVDYGASTPVDVPGLRGVPYNYNPGSGINARWSGYNWDSKVWLDEARTIPNPRYINYPFSPDESNLTADRYPIVISNNMADSRGYRVEVATDGYLYAAFEFDGGNTPLRWSPFDLEVAKDPVGGDIFHQTFNTSTVPKVFFARYVAATGEQLLSQWYINRLYNATGPARDNTVRMKGGTLWADETGRVYIGGTSAYGLPLPGNEVYSPNPGETTFNPFLPTDYVGGAYFMVFSTDFATRLYTTRLSTGANTRAIAARRIGAEPWPRIAWGGGSSLAAPLFTANPLQPQPGYGDSDATLAVLGGELSDDAGFTFTADFTSGYTTAKLDLRDNAILTHFPVDADGDGLTDDARSGFTLILPTGATPAETPLSPSAGYTGPAFYGGFFSDWLDSASSSLADKDVATTELLIRAQPGTPAYHHGVFLFPKSVFAGIEPTDILSFGAGDALEIDATEWGGGAELRYLVRQGTDFFVSEAAFTTPGAIAFVQDVEDGRWALWDIPEDMDFHPDAADFQARNFTDITGVGFILDTPAANAGRFYLRLRRFSVGMQVNAPDNLPPVPAFTATPGSGQVPLTVTFDSAPSSDPDGAINFVSWNFGDGEKMGGNVVTHDYLAAGAYPAIMKVYDDKVAIQEAVATIHSHFGISADPASIFASFGGDTVDTNTDFPGYLIHQLDLDGDFASDDILQGVPFSATESITETGVRGTPLYGALAVQSVDGKAGFSERRIKSTGNPDEISVRVQGEDAPGGALMRGLLYLDKSGFLGDAANTPVSFTAGSTIKVRTTARWDALGTARWLVRDGSAFYVSETPASITSRATATLGFSSASDHGSWAVYDPAADPSLDFDQAGAVYATRRFSDVTGIGIFFERDSYSAERIWLTIDVMEATGVVGTSQQAAYTDWLNLWFTPEELANPALESTLWGLAADPDGDGANSLEMLLMGNPQVFDLPGLITVSTDGLQLVLTLKLRKAVDGVPCPAAFAIEDSLSLLPGSWSTVFDSALCALAGPTCTQGDVVYNVLEEFSDYRRVEIRLPVGDARFVRVRAP